MHATNRSMEAMEWHMVVNYTLSAYEDALIFMIINLVSKIYDHLVHFSNKMVNTKVTKPSEV